MAVLCCCPQLIHNRRHRTTEHARQIETSQALPIRPPAAILPAPDPDVLALSPQSTAARSSLTNTLPGAEAEASVHLAELVVEDSEDEIGEDEMAHTNRNRSTSTLDAVKARIRRHLSQDPVPGQSETEEQIARRAEVKRLMRKRIQEELQSEDNPILGGLSTLQHPVPPSVASVTILGSGPRDTIEFTVDEVSKDEELAKAKPALMSEFSDSGVRQSPRPVSKQLSIHSSDKENRRMGSRPVSLRDCNEHDLGVTHSSHYTHLRQRSSLPGMPLSPQLQPIRTASLHDTASLISWRLSLSADRLAGLLTPDKTRTRSRRSASPADSRGAVKTRPGGGNIPSSTGIAPSSLATHTAEDADKLFVSQNSLHSSRPDRCIPKSSSLVRDESPVGLWLRAQSQQFRLSAGSPIPSAQHPDDEFDSHCSGSAAEHTRQFDVLDAQIESSNSTQCSRGAAWEHRAAASIVLLSGVEKVRTSSRKTSGFEHNTKDRSPAGVSLTSRSSGDSQTPAPEDAGRPLQNSFRRGFAGIRLPSFRCEVTSQLFQVIPLIQKGHLLSSKSPESSRLDPASKPRSEIAIPSLSTSHPRQTALGTGAETSSCIRRGAELQTVEERSRESHLRNRVSVNTGTRFHEVLSDSPRFAARNSPLAKLELTLPVEFNISVEKFDGNDSDHDHLSSDAADKSKIRGSSNLDTPGFGQLKVPSTGHDRAESSVKGLHLPKDNHGSTRARGFSSSRDGDKTAEMWKRALRAESISNSARRSTSTQPAAPRSSSPAVKSNTRLPQAPCPSEIGDVSVHGSPVHSPTCTELPTKNDEEAFRLSLVRSNIVLEEWGHQLERQDQEHTAKTYNMPSVSPRIYQNSITPPASWAKFPSHDREQRNATAGELDSVKPKDFAMRGGSAVDGIIWTTDKGKDGAPSHKSIVRSVSDRFTQPFKSRWNKLVPVRTGTSVKDRSIRGARRSSIQASGDLEYPELELLPTAGGYRELLALEREINEMKGVVEPQIRLSSDETGALENRRSLVERLTGAQQHDGSSDADDVERRHVAGSIKGLASSAIIFSPATPATPATRNAGSACMHDKELTDSSGERYATPFTHFSLSRPLTPQPTTHPPAAAYIPGSTPASSSEVSAFESVRPGEDARC